MTRPPVSVVVPFKGSDDEADEVVRVLLGLALREGDELLAVDNTQDGTLARRADGAGVRVLPATLEASSYHARNVGAAAARAPWLLFLDAGCVPVRPDLLDAYFAEPVGDRAGILVGRVVGAPEQEALVARFARARRHLDQEASLRHPVAPFGATANLLVRRALWEQLGGFCDRIRSGGDQDFCWRAYHAGAGVELRRGATVQHTHRESVRGLSRQFVRYGAGAAWLRRRHGVPSSRTPVWRVLAKFGVHGGRSALRRDWQDVAFRALDVVQVTSNGIGYLLDNRPPRTPLPRPHGTVSATVRDVFPDAVGSGGAWHLEAGRRPAAPHAERATTLEVFYGEDDGPLRCWRDAAWLVRREPGRAVRLVSGGRSPAALVRCAPAVRRLAAAEAVLVRTDGPVAARERAITYALGARPAAGDAAASASLP